MNSDPHFWFPAKRYGWGWGLPASWEGWVALAVFAVLMVAGVFLFPPDRQVVRFVAYTCVLSIGLIAVAWLKGEPLRWRWGRD